MPSSLRLIIAQLNLKAGDILNNTKKIIYTIEKAKSAFNADLILFPEQTIVGYPAEDLLLRPDFIKASATALNEIIPHTKDISIVIGHPELKNIKLYNAASFVHDQQLLVTYYKQFLPNYGVFDEQRYFAVGNSPCIQIIKGIPTAIMICEDIWFAEPTQQAVAAGAKLILCLNASPFSYDKHEKRLEILKQRAKESNLPIIYAACVGGQDEIVFDGGSMVINSNGDLCAHAGFFQETLLPITLEYDKQLTITAPPLPNLEPSLARIWNALVLGVRDYVTKNNFPGVLIGLSGGIDSALTAAIAVDALGKEKVHAVMMPSQYTSALSLDLAFEQARLLDIRYSIISIEEIFQCCLTTLAPEFANYAEDTTEENLQARCRGIILMALSNKTGSLVLTTSNKSEMAVGYATLYGDMAGGFAVLKDVWKTTVFELARYRNRISLSIPEAVISRPPTAELKANQKDEDSLPPYAILDDILQRYLENHQSITDICAAGFADAVVKKIVHLVKVNEYKRRQSPPGVKITNRAFGRERRYPITSGFDG